MLSTANIFQNHRRPRGRIVLPLTTVSLAGAVHSGIEALPLVARISVALGSFLKL
jgi:hypothetical protein